MKKILLILAMMLFAGCEHANDATSANDYNDEYVYSSSSVRTNDYVYSSSSVKSYWALEVGYVCNGYNIDVVINDPSRAVESYYAMYQICGDRSTQTYECVDAETAAAALTRLFNQTTATEVVNRSKQYGATFGFYNAVDGYMRYVYFELCYDGKALLKSH